VGFDYEIQKKEKNIEISMSQVFNEKENKKMPTSMGLDEKISDLVGVANYKINDKFNFNYKFAIDQNYNDFNYNEIGAQTNLDKLSFNINYLEENKHIGDNKYLKSKIDYKINMGTSLSYEFKRNLITDSSEFYNLSYEYFNDCLRAGLVYRREFYNDSEIEAEDSLMFKITLTPFGDLNSPKIYQ
jgi:LPS-assembly protein